MATFNDFLESVKSDLLEFANENIVEYKEELLKDGNAFIEKSKEDIERWAEELAAGDLSEKDFKYLLKGKKDLAEMEALKQLGLSRVRIDKIKNGLLDVVVGSAVKTFL